VFFRPLTANQRRRMLDSDGIGTITAHEIGWRGTFIRRDYTRAGAGRGAHPGALSFQLVPCDVALRHRQSASRGSTHRPPLAKFDAPGTFGVRPVAKIEHPTRIRRRRLTADKEHHGGDQRTSEEPTPPLTLRVLVADRTRHKS
jgi:hypothetical protein